MVMRNRAIVGVLLNPDAKNALVQNVSPGLPAAVAGLRAGDVIEKVDGQVMKAPQERQSVPRQVQAGRPDHRPSHARRQAADVENGTGFVRQSGAEDRRRSLTRLSEAGGTVSRRHGSFVSAFTHDTVIQATDCGGPIVNLDGRAVGLNIARVDRTATYAIPASMLRMLMPEMLPK